MRPTTANAAAVSALGAERPNAPLEVVSDWAAPVAEDVLLDPEPVAEPVSDAPVGVAEEAG